MSGKPVDSAINPLTQSAIAAAMGLSGRHSTVRDALKVSGKKSESEAMPLTPDHLKGHTDQADFRKLSPEGQAVGKVEDSTAKPTTPSHLHNPTTCAFTNKP